MVRWLIHHNLMNIYPFSVKKSSLATFATRYGRWACILQENVNSEAHILQDILYNM